MKLIHIATIIAAFTLAGCSNSMRQFDAYSTAPAPAATEDNFAEDYEDPQDEVADVSESSDEDDGYVYYESTEQFEAGEDDVSSDTSAACSPHRDRLLWCIAKWHGGDKANTIVIITDERALYVVNKGSLTATRFPIAVGKEEFIWTGEAKVGDKKINPTWTPPAEMIERKPQLEEWANGMPGGIPENPLGTRAFYLHDAVDGGDTLYRIHGTNDPKSIGTAASSGCIRMLNAHVEWLYERVPVGARVVVAESRGQDMAELLE